MNQMYREYIEFAGDIKRCMTMLYPNKIRNSLIQREKMRSHLDDFFFFHKMSTMQKVSISTMIMMEYFGLEWKYPVLFPT